MFNPAHSEEMGFVPLGTCEWNRSLMRLQKTEKFCCGKYPNRFTHPGKHILHDNLNKKGGTDSVLESTTQVRRGVSLIMRKKYFGLVKKDVA